MNMNMNNPMMNNMNMSQLMNFFTQMMNNMNNNNMNNNNMINNNINNNNMNNNNINNNNMNNNNNNKINIVFIVAHEGGSETKHQFIVDVNESLSSVISRYIDKTHDYNINYYIFNGKRLDETLKVSEVGFQDGSTVFVVNTQNILGAKFK